MLGNFKRSGDITPDSEWRQDGVLVAGDAVGTANRVTGLAISPARNLPFRRLYVAALAIPNYSTGYSPGANDCQFVLRILNEKTEFLRAEWGNSNGTGISYPVTTGRVPVGQLRPQFRIASRTQGQPFMTGWVEPMVPDGVEFAFRAQNAAPAAEALEWLVCCAPFRFNAEISSIEINAERSTGVTPDQLFFWVGCLSSAVPI